MKRLQRITGWATAAALLGSLLLPWPSPAAAAAKPQPKLTLQASTPVTSGATLKTYKWTSARGTQKVATDVRVVEVDLTNPYVNIDVMTGKSNQFTQRNTVLGMAGDSGAVAGVNGDYFDVTAEGAPIGPQISKGDLMSSPSVIKGMYAFGITKDNQPVIDQFAFQGSVTAAGGQSFPLSGINETYYYKDPDHVYSHTNSLYMYTSAWGSADRANNGYAHYTEVLVENGVVKAIQKGGFKQLPPKDGYILWGHGKAEDFINQQIKVGDAITADYRLTSIDGTRSYDPAQFKTMIGGHTILIDGGKEAAWSRDVSSLGGYRSRTGVGYSKDGKKAYIIAADKNDVSDGLSLSEFQQVMLAVGVWKGLNLDGGGSTQMVARPLGDFKDKLVNGTEYGTARQVVNGLGVFTTAPKGKVKGILISGNTTLFINESTVFQMKAYDEYYNPVDTSSLQVDAKLDHPIGTWAGKQFTASRPGTATLTLTSDLASKEVPVKVYGNADVVSLQFDPALKEELLSAGEDFKLPVSAVTADGGSREVPPQSLSWQLVGFDGSVDPDGTLHVAKAPDSGIGHVIARYDGFSTMLTLPGGTDKLWANFDDKTVPVAMQKTPDEVKGRVSIVNGIPGRADDSNAVYLAYNFKEGTGTKALYAAFGDGGLPVEGAPVRMKLNVFGDKSFNWIRAEFLDKNGKKYMVDLNQHIDWYGWRELSANLASYRMAYPVKLTRIYLADPENGQDEREPVGELAFDDVIFQYPGTIPSFEQKTVKMALNRMTADVNGKREKLDQAPLLEKATTMIPIRFFVDVMGGQVSWDPQQKKVTVLKNDHLIELWVDQPDVVVDGTRVTADVPPMLKNNRTLLPLRLISEKLGWTVSWEEKTQSIVLQSQ